MSQKNLVTENILRIERDEQDRIATMSFIFNDDPEARLEVIDSDSPFDDVNGKTAIGAYLELLSYGLYDHKDTDEISGLLFMFANPLEDNSNGQYRSVMGYVAKEYNGEKDFGSWPRYRQQSGGWYTPEWAVVNRSVRGKYKLTRTRMKKTESVETKGDWLWSASQRINLQVRVLPFSAWAESVLETASVEDPEERVAMFWEKYNKARARNTERQANFDELTKVNQGRQALPTALSVKVGEDFVPLESTPHQEVKVHYPYGPETHMWDGSVNAKIRFARVARQGHQCELLG